MDNASYKESIAKPILKVIIPFIAVVCVGQTALILLRSPEEWHRVIPVAVILSGLVVMGLLMNKGRYLFTAHTLIGFVLIAIITGMALNGWTSAPIYDAFFPLIAFAAFLSSKKTVITIALIAVAMGAAPLLFPNIPMLAPHDIDPEIALSSRILFIAIVALAVVVPSSLLYRLLIKSEDLTAMLQDREATLSTIVNGTSDLVWSVDPVDFRVQTFNSRVKLYCLEIFNIEVQTGMSANDVLPSEISKELNLYYQKAVANGSIQAEIVFQTLKGEQALLLSFDCVTHNGSVSSIIVIGKDIQQRKAYEQALVTAREAAENSSKIKSEFLANMSHEIRTPMNGVLGMLRLLQTTDMEQEQKEYINAAIQSSKRLTQLLSDILDLSQVEANRLTIKTAPLDLGEVTRQVCEMFGPTMRQTQIKLTCEVASTIPKLLNGDPVRLQQVLTNLIGNALKFTEEGSIIVEAFPLATAKEDSFRILFSVSDTGIGIPDDKLEKLFQPFSQVTEGYRRDYQGAGLGLSICKRLVELMGGNITIESEPDKGTTIHFCITFGLDEVLPKRAPTDPQQVTTGPLKILLVEDEKVNRIATTRLLEKSGHSVESAENGADAISLLDQHHFDIVLMDIQMPVLDGVEATKAIRRGDAGQANKDIPIIATTAYAMSKDKDKFLEVGMNEHLAKPVDLEQLEALLKSLSTQAIA